MEKESRKYRRKTSKKDRERENSKRISAQEILEVEKSVWKRRIRKNAY